MSGPIAIAVLGLFLLVRAGHNQTKLKVLQLVAMVSDTSNDEVGRTQDWERGLEILPGARVAVRELNGNTEILPGYQLELVEIITEGCSSNLALVQLIQHLTTNTEEEGEERQTVGIIGPICIAAADLIAGVVGRPSVSLVQITATPPGSSSDRNSENPYLFRILLFNQAVINTLFGLMTELGRDKLTVLCFSDLECGIGDQFVNEAHSNLKVEVADFLRVSEQKTVKSALPKIRESGARIVLGFLSDTLATELMCAAYLEEMNWPEYGWIFPALEHEGFETRSMPCDSSDFAVAIEGLILLEHFSVDPSTQLVSGNNYSTFYSSYLQELRETANRTQRDLQSNFYASVFYDSVWAFALALKQSNLQSVKTSKFPHDGDTAAINITSSLLNLSRFTGSTGPIAFNGNHNRKHVAILIEQIQNSKAVAIGEYDSLSDTLSITGELNGFPSNDLEQQYDTLPVPFAVLFATLDALCIVFLTVTLFLYIYYRREPEIRATSTPLTWFMFLGCYLILLGSYFLTIFASVEHHSTFDRITSCQLLLWLTGLGLIVFTGTLLLRIVRLWRVFSHFGHMGNLYTNRCLIVVVLCLVLVLVAILTVWAAVDVYQYIDRVTTCHPVGERPYIEVEQYCDSDYYALWITMVAAYYGLLLVGVVFVAVKTRKIRNANFKDTKKLNFLVGIHVVTWVFFPSLVVIVSDAELEFALNNLASVVTVLSSQFLLFLPKVWPPLSRSLNKYLHTNSRVSGTSTQ